MQAKQMGDALREFALLVEEAGNTRSATDLRGTADALSHGGTETVAQVVGKVQKQWKASKRVAAHPATLKSQLERIATVLRAAGATAPAKDCASMLKLFAGDPYAHAATFNAELSSAIQAPAPTPKTKPKSLDAAAIRSLADKLIASSTDNALFDAVVAELDANGQIKKVELESVANLFLGSERKFKSKAEILKAIKNRQLQDAIQASRDRRIAKIAV